MEQSAQDIWVWVLAGFSWGFPFLSFLIGMFFLRRAPKNFSLLATVFSGISALAGWIIFVSLFNSDEQLFSVPWWGIGTAQFDFSLSISGAGRLMLVIVSSVSFLVNIYSLEYMRHEAGKIRYFAWLGFFSFSMIGIVLADSLLVMFFFWESVGAASYFLIGFWHKKESANLASLKAFIVNRLGDLGFLIGISLIYVVFKTLSISEIQAMVDAIQWKGEEFNFVNGQQLISTTPLTITVIGLFLLGGVVAKSAQAPLQIWLPDAMEGPTPVSALIHAATMVAAGIYLLARLFFLFTPATLTVIACIGTVTALMGAVAAISQHDIKKVLAFSTVSQLGFMVLAIGVGGREEGLFHLATHAAFKAGLFLAAGSIIHALHQYAHRSGKSFDAQDMRLMGGMRHLMPVTFAVFVVTALAISGFPLFSGFLSKDAIIAKAFSWASAEGGLRWAIPVTALFCTLLTAFYMTRTMMMVFFGANKTPGHATLPSIGENNRMIIIPLIVLGAGSFWIWFNVNPFGQGSWLMDMVETNKTTISGLYLETTSEISHRSIVIMSVLASLSGIGLAYMMYEEEEDLEIAELDEKEVKPGFWTSLSQNNWHLNELYNQSVIYSFWQVQNACVWVDRKVIDTIVNYLAVIGVVVALLVKWIDKYVVDGLVYASAAVTELFGRIVRSFQGGAVQKYIAWSLFFTLLLIAWILI